MTSPVTPSGRDLRTLAHIVTDDRSDLPPDGLPPSLLTELKGLIPCDDLSFFGHDSDQQEIWFMQESIAGYIPAGAGEDRDDGYWDLHSACAGCNYPERTGDLRSIIKVTDFYSARQWRRTGMYTDYYRPAGLENDIMLTLPAGRGPAARAARSVRLIFLRGSGPDFSERDRDLLTLLRPHLQLAYLETERRRHPAPRLTARQQDLMGLVAAGHTNTQIARRLGLSEGTVRTHLVNIYGRLQVSSRTAAVTRAFPNGTPG
jgi:DNA-binding CsgD family transcriptional regulator